MLSKERRTEIVANLVTRNELATCGGTNLLDLTRLYWPHVTELWQRVDALERQERFVNSTLALQAVALLASLFRYDEIRYHGGFVNQSCHRRRYHLAHLPAVLEKDAENENPRQVATRRFVERG